MTDRHSDGLLHQNSELYDSSLRNERPSMSISVRGADAQTVRLNVLNSSVQDARMGNAAKMLLYLQIFYTVPQIITAIILLSLHWNEDHTCGRIKFWSVVHTIGLTVKILMDIVSYKVNLEGTWLRSVLHPQYTGKVKSVVDTVHMFFLFWFIVGNFWMFGSSEECATDNALYDLALGLIIMCYAKAFLPCMLLIAFLPMLYFCLPCLIYVLQRFFDPYNGQRGATQEKLDTLEKRDYEPGIFPDDVEPSCCICINDYEVGESLRVLSCEHHFHLKCVDTWLLRNATCPTCRTRILEDEHDTQHNSDHMV